MQTELQKLATKVNFQKLRLKRVETTLSEIMREFPEVFQAEANRKNPPGSDAIWIIERIRLFGDELSTAYQTRKKEKTF